MRQILQPVKKFRVRGMLDPADTFLFSANEPFTHSVIIIDCANNL